SGGKTACFGNGQKDLNSGEFVHSYPFCFLIGNNYILKSHFFSLFISLKCTPSIAIKLNV
ncbi:hypothetical protein, partial [Glaesserella parasuis]|uniref:hypothetical protein n=1 Tax=Glaesserella parasuis TaxID=738 RepID=UPI0024373D62